MLPQRGEIGKRAVDAAVVVQGLLRGKAVKTDAETLERRLDSRQHRLDPSRRQVVEPVSRCAGAVELLGQRDQIIPGIAVLGRLLAAHPSGDRCGKALNLTAGVIGVVLAADRVAIHLQQPRQRIAVGGVAATGRRQRPGRIGRDELDQDALAFGVCHAQLGLCQQAGGRLAIPGGREEEVDEPGAGDLERARAGEARSDALDQLARDLTRRLAEHRGKQHRSVGRVVAQLGLGWTLECRLGARG